MIILALLALICVTGGILSLNPYWVIAGALLGISVDLNELKLTIKNKK